ncbi:MAG: CpaF family protein [Planctomycetota bacterium]
MADTPDPTRPDQTAANDDAREPLPRELLSRTHLALPQGRARDQSRNGPRSAFEKRYLEGETEPSRDIVGYASIKSRLHARLLDELDEQDMLDTDEERLAAHVRDFTARILATEDLTLNDDERRNLSDDLMQETVGLGPLAPLMADPAVTDILVNGYNRVYVERFGRLEHTAISFRDNEHLIRIIQRIAASIGRRIDEASPMVDARLRDGSRVNATLPPISIDGATLSIRRFGTRRLTRDDLRRLRMLSDPMLTFLDLAVRGKLNVLISGGTGAGKSTLLGALCESIGQRERIITIEDAAELVLTQQHVVRLETRPPNIEGTGRVGTRELVMNSLRMRPDRIIVGEVRGPEAFDMLQSMNTGHDGGLTTIHANSPRDALSRLETMVLTAGTELPSKAIREQMTSALQLVVHVRRFEDGVRRIGAISEITGMEGDTPQLQEIFGYKYRGTPGGPRTITGSFATAGIVPRCVETLRERGINVPIELFHNAD